MIISLIAAVAKGNIIGCNNQMPWQDEAKFAADLDYFRKVTFGKPVVMGRKTHESIGRILPKRPNIVVTSNVNYASPYNENSDLVTIYHDLDDAINALAAARNPEIFIIGGGDVYHKMVTRADNIYLTELNYTVANTEGCIKFPDFDRNKWNKSLIETHKDTMQMLKFSRCVP